MFCMSLFNDWRSHWRAGMYQGGGVVLAWVPLINMAAANAGATAPTANAASTPWTCTVISTCAVMEAFLRAANPYRAG